MSENALKHFFLSKSSSTGDRYFTLGKTQSERTTKKAVKSKKPKKATSKSLVKKKKSKTSKVKKKTIKAYQNDLL